MVSLEAGPRLKPYEIEAPAGGATWTVTTERGFFPAWSRDGTELFFRNATGVMAVHVHRSRLLPTAD